MPSVLEERRPGDALFGSWRLSMDPPPAAFAKMLRKVRNDLRNWRPVWKAILPKVAAMVERNISAQGAPLGERWPELGRESLRKRERKGMGRSLLQFTGRLYAASSNIDATITIGPRRLVFGPQDRYMFVQHYGSKQKKIPARPYLNWTPAMEAEVLALCEHHIRMVIDRNEGRLAQYGSGGLL